VLSDAEEAKARAENPSNIRQATDDNQKTTDGLLDGKDLASGRGTTLSGSIRARPMPTSRARGARPWIVDPPNGQVPLSDDGKKLMASLRGGRGRGSGYDNPEERARVSAASSASADRAARP